MPGGIHAEGEYHELIRMQRLVNNRNMWENMPTNLKNRTSLYLAGLDANSQFKRDTALWYGAVHQPGPAWKGDFIKKLFSVLYWGGLMVKRGNQWIFYYSQRIPICSAISHTARVLIQLPDNTDAFWNWLWGGQTPQTRAAASHGVSNSPTETIHQALQIRKSVRETKKSGNVKVNHFGVNIALGGYGNTHLISGKTIQDNGEHGHLYLAYSQTAANNRKALLVGAEQSAPIDRYGTDQGGFWTGVKRFFQTGKVGVGDNYGGGHSITAGHSRYSSTGGDDFGYTKTKKRLGWFKIKKSTHDIKGAMLYNYGPSRENYYDGIFVDLTRNRFEDIRAKQFDPVFLGYRGLPCKSGRPPVPPRPARPALKRKITIGRQ